MIPTLKKLFVSKKSILVVFIVLATVIAISVIIPQQRDGVQSAAWYRAYPLLERFVTAGGLDHIYGTWWFLVITAFFLMSLCISTCDQGRIAWKRMVGEGRLSYVEEVKLAGNREQVELQLLYNGYWTLHAATATTRLVKNPWGFWGNFMLHLGLALTVLFAVVYKATEHRFITRVVEGEEIYFNGENSAERKGVLAGTMAVPAAIRVTAVTPEFYDNGQLLSLSSTGTFRSGNGEITPYHVAINGKISYEGMRVYQMNSFGTAFLLSLRSPGKPGGNEILYLPAPSRRDTAAYGSLDLPGGEYTLKAKYGEPSGRPKSAGEPLLTLRLQRGKDLLGEVSLVSGVAGSLGPFAVSMQKTGWWTEYLFEGSSGTAGIFTGFACILLGVVITYGAIPYVAVISTNDRGTTISWQSQACTMFFRDERDRVLTLARNGDIQ